MNRYSLPFETDDDDTPDSGVTLARPRGGRRDSQRAANTFADFPMTPGGNIPMISQGRHPNRPVTSMSPGDAALLLHAGEGARLGYGGRYAMPSQVRQPAPAPAMPPFMKPGYSMAPNGRLITPASFNQTDTQSNKAMGSATGSSPAFAASVAKSRALRSYTSSKYADMRAAGLDERQAGQRAFAAGQGASADLDTGGAFTDRENDIDANARENDATRANVRALDESTNTGVALRGPQIDAFALQNQATAKTMPSVVQGYANQAEAGRIANEHAGKMSPILADQGKAQADAMRTNSPFYAQQLKQLEMRNKQLEQEAAQRHQQLQVENEKLRGHLAKFIDVDGGGEDAGAGAGTPTPDSTNSSGYHPAGTPANGGGGLPPVAGATWDPHKQVGGPPLPLRTGTAPDGRRVVQYSDGSVKYAQ